MIKEGSRVRIRKNVTFSSMFPEVTQWKMQGTAGTVIHCSSVAALVEFGYDQHRTFRLDELEEAAPEWSNQSPLVDGWYWFKRPEAFRTPEMILVFHHLGTRQFLGFDTEAGAAVWDNPDVHGFWLPVLKPTDYPGKSE